MILSLARIGKRTHWLTNDEDHWQVSLCGLEQRKVMWTKVSSGNIPSCPECLLRKTEMAEEEQLTPWEKLASDILQLTEAVHDKTEPKERCYGLSFAIVFELMARMFADLQSRDGAKLAIVRPPEELSELGDRAIDVHGSPVEAAGAVMSLLLANLDERHTKI